MGVLFHFTPSPAKVYQAVGEKHGIFLPEDLLKIRMKWSFQTAPPLAFGEYPREKRREMVARWWKKRVEEIFFFRDIRVSVLQKLFEELWEWFSDPSHFQIDRTLFSFPSFPHIHHYLLTRYDHRIYKILPSFPLPFAFERIWLSMDLYEEKPHRKAFLPFLSLWEKKGGVAILVDDRESHRIAGKKFHFYTAGSVQEVVSLLYSFFSS
jgi:FMN phosphatase YigB (HAD superfamily)